MQLNTLQPAEGSKHAKKRRGRGIGSTLGKTSGRGVKGQHARSGGFHKRGFEGGQMPLQMRLPKFGFHSHKKIETAQVRLSELALVKADVIDVLALKAAGIIHAEALHAKVFQSGKLEKPVKLQGIRVTAGAKAVIEKLGGSVN